MCEPIDIDQEYELCPEDEEDAEDALFCHDGECSCCEDSIDSEKAVPKHLVSDVHEASIAVWKIVRAPKRSALAAFDAAAANYQSVVLESLRNVADVLRALENDAQAMAALAAADAAAQGSLQSVQRQYALGAASYVQQLIAQQAAQQTRINLIAAQAQRLVDSAALYQAMGGGVN